MAAKLHPYSITIRVNDTRLFDTGDFLLELHGDARNICILPVSRPDGAGQFAWTFNVDIEPLGNVYTVNVIYKSASDRPRNEQKCDRIVIDDIAAERSCTFSSENTSWVTVGPDCYVLRLNNSGSVSVGPKSSRRRSAGLFQASSDLATPEQHAALHSTARIVFEVTYFSKGSITMYVSGSAKSLGAWDPKKSLRMERFSSLNGAWRGAWRLELFMDEIDTSFDYKYTIMDDISKKKVGESDIYSKSLDAAPKGVLHLKDTLRVGIIDSISTPDARAALARRDGVTPVKMASLACPAAATPSSGKGKGDADSDSSTDSGDERDVCRVSNLDDTIDIMNVSYNFEVMQSLASAHMQPPRRDIWETAKPPRPSKKDKKAAGEKDTQKSLRDCKDSILVVNASKEAKGKASSSTPAVDPPVCAAATTPPPPAAPEPITSPDHRKFIPEALQFFDKQVEALKAVIRDRIAVFEEVEKGTSLAPQKEREIELLKGLLNRKTASMNQIEGMLEEINSIRVQSDPNYVPRRSEYIDSLRKQTSPKLSPAGKEGQTQDVKQMQELQARMEETNRASSEQLQTLGAQVEALAQENDVLHAKWQSEFEERKKVFDQLQDLKGSIRVFCRVRPGFRSQLTVSSSIRFLGQTNPSTCTGMMVGDKSFDFNQCFTPESTQEDVYNEASGIVTSVMDGFNVCVFAYGQTGAGKTFTMNGPKDNPGVNYRALSELFEVRDSRSATFDYEIELSILEVYNDQIFDLLREETSKPAEKLDIKLGSEGVHVPGLSRLIVDSHEDVWEALEMAMQMRSQGNTEMNKESSRSHLLVSVQVTCTCKKSGVRSRGKLNLIDLAGSERLARSKAEGDRLKEAQHINKSLAALGDVFSALLSKKSHVPFRNSKLTHILQDSLIEGSKTLMFVNVSPEEDDIAETTSSLMFASRVSKVELGRASKHSDSAESIALASKVQQQNEAIARKDREIEELKAQLKSAAKQLDAASSAAKSSTPSLSRMRSEKVRAQVRPSPAHQTLAAHGSVTVSMMSPSSLRVPSAGGTRSGDDVENSARKVNRGSVKAVSFRPKLESPLGRVESEQVSMGSSQSLLKNGDSGKARRFLRAGAAKGRDPLVTTPSMFGKPPKRVDISN